MIVQTNRMCMKNLLLAMVAASLCFSSRGNIRLPGIMGNGMVLQQQQKVKLWGWCEPMEKITVTTSWNNRSYPTTGSRDARWEVIVETPAAGGPYTIGLQGNNHITLQDVLIGEVWVCSGQSNMEMNLQWGRLQDIKEELPHASAVPLRFFHIPKTTAAFPQDNCAASWTVCDSNSLQTFSAVAYFFGKRLTQVLHVPVGLIEAAWGGTAAEVWTPDSVVQADAVLRKAAAAIAPSGMCPYLPGYAFNGMIAPVSAYAIAGVIWYQGENNTATAGSYARLFTAMIDAWRKRWQQRLPFYYVQIAPFAYRLPNTGALLREAQLACMAHPQTGMVVTTDLVKDTNDVHPADKHTVGQRLANWALAETYGRQGLVYKSPVFKNMHLQKDRAVVVLDNAVNGLMIKGPVVNGLQIAGEDGVFYTAEVRLEGNSIVAWSKMVKHPVAVRYAFSNTAVGNIFSQEGLPVAPFRTDDWTIATQ